MASTVQPVEFWLSLARGDTAVAASLRRAGSGGPGDVVAEGASDAAALDEVDALLRRLARYIEDPPEPGLVEDLGRRLAGIALPGPVRAWMLGEVLRGGARPILLRISADDPELAAMPWEYLFLEDHGPGAREPLGFLALHPSFRLARTCGERPGDMSPAPGPLRVLVVSANPGSGTYPALPWLAQEARAVLSALRSAECAVEAEELRYATPGALERALADEPPHILHYIGHAAALPSGGALVLHGERAGNHALLYGAELARWLEGGPTRLVVLAGCRTGGDAGSLARAVTEGAQAAVVATQLPLRDASAALFARALYGALGAYAPVDEAVAQARQAVRGVGPDWGVPVLYLPAGPELFARPVEREAAPWTVPFPHNPDFLGRDALLAELHSALEAPDRRGVALAGMSGLGKTLLAAEYAHAFAGDYPGGVFWLNARDGVRLEEEYAAHGRLFGVPEDLPPARRAEMVLDRLRLLPAPSLLILDDVAEPAELRLPAGGMCRVLVTTRERRSVPEGFRSLEPRSLDAKAALELLAQGRPLDGDEAHAAVDVAAALGCLPIALVIAAREVRRLGVTFGAYGQRLARHRVRALGTARGRFVTGTGRDGSVFDAIDLAARNLTPAASSVLLSAACFAGTGIPRDLLRQAADVNELEAFDEALAELWDSSLVTYEAGERLSVHELVRAYTHGQAPPERLHDSVDRVARLLGERLKEANDAAEWGSVRADIPHCRAALTVCREAGQPEGMVGLLHELGGYLHEHGEFGVAETCCREAVKHAEAAGHRDDMLVAPLLARLAEVRSSAGDASGALEGAERAWAIADASLPADDARRVEYLNALGYVHRWRRDFDAARAFYEGALAAAERAHGRASAQATMCLNNIGTVHLKRGDHAAALACWEEALRAAEELYGPSHVRMAIALNNSGRLLGSLERWAEALELHRRALAIYETTQAGENLDLAMTRYYVGRALGKVGLAAEAVDELEQACVLLERLMGPEHSLTRDALKDLDESERCLKARAN